MVRKALFLTCFFCAPPLAAQDAPLSAIEWLVVQPAAPTEFGVTIAPPIIEAPVAQTAAIPEVEVQPLSAPTPGGVGLLPKSVTGLPDTIWRGSDPAELARAIDQIARRGASVPAMDALFHTLLLAEAAPSEEDTQNTLLLARIDALSHRGLVEPAEALLDRAGMLDRDLFKRAFALSLLTGTDESLCAMLSQNAFLTSDVSTRIWCAVRAGDFAHAVTLFQTAEALDELSRLDEELLLRYLDPEYAEVSDPLRPPVRPTELQFRLFEAIGEALPTATLPRRFAAVALGGDFGWKSQLEAAERLARTGAISGNRMLGIYTERMRAASGGVWDRVEALQQFETALNAGDLNAISSTLMRVWPQMRSVGLLVPFSQIFGPRLQGVPLQADARTIALKAGLLSDEFEDVASKIGQTPAEFRFLASLALGLAFEGETPDFTNSAPLRQVWADPLPIVETDSHRLGADILAEIMGFREGADGNPRALTASLRALRSYGLEGTARRAALQLAILDMEGARR